MSDIKVFRKKSNWKLYTSTVPANVDVLGVVEYNNQKGAFVRFHKTELYAMVSANCITNLDQKLAKKAHEAASSEQLHDLNTMSDNEYSANYGFFGCGRHTENYITGTK